MDHFLLILATLLASAAGGWCMWSVHRGTRSRWIVVWMVAVLLCQFGFLVLRGRARQACPLNDPGEILVYLSWAVTLFYLATGAAFRLSLLGMFSIPLVVVMQLSAMPFLFGGAAPAAVADKGALHTLHSATAALAYGALGLAAISGVMFMTLDRQLKERRLGSGLFRNMPPSSLLLVAMERLLWIGVGLLTVGIIAGHLSPGGLVVNTHLFLAYGTWACYTVLLLTKAFRGMSGRKLSFAAVAVFLAALSVFISI